MTVTTEQIGACGPNPESFLTALSNLALKRAVVVPRGRELWSPVCQSTPIETLSSSPDYANHEAIFIGRDPAFETLFFAFVHDTRRGLAQGGCRFKEYATLGDLISDGLRLSQGMTRKNALAGLWWGGGKGIIAVTEALKKEPEIFEVGSPRRNALFEAYGRFVASLNGVYYTAEDIGTKTADMNAILRTNRFVTCIGRELGGSGNPSPHTARGVLQAIKAGWFFLTGTNDLAGVRVGVQGVGNVGGPLVEELAAAGASLVLTDSSVPALAAIAAKIPGARIIDPELRDTIFDQDVDILAPCAIGKQINAANIPRLKARLICGAANNILEEIADDERLQARGITFVPDYVANRSGIINCANEWCGYLEEDVAATIPEIYPLTLKILNEAKTSGVTPTVAANRLADEAAAILHPLMGHRGRRLIDHLIASDWHLKG